MVKAQQNVYYQFNCSKLRRGDILLIYSAVPSQFWIDSATLGLNALNDKISTYTPSVTLRSSRLLKISQAQSHSERLNVRKFVGAFR